MIDIDIQGLDSFKAKLAGLDKEGRKRVNRQINVNAIEFHRAVIQSIDRPSGRHKAYPRGGGNYHWSSKPGRPPNRDNGDLVEMLIITKDATLGRSYAEIRSGASYSAPLEFGHGNVEKRPFMGPMLKKKRRLFMERIKRAMEAAL